MKAFHNDIKIKKKYFSRVQAHRKADELIKGYYWESGKGCTVGCTIHGNDHKRYETELGIPEWLARVEDTIFEGLPNKEAKMWPEKFLKSIPVGAAYAADAADAAYADAAAANAADAADAAYADAAANAATYAAYATAYDAAATCAATRQKSYVKFSYKLLELLSECK